MREPESIQIDGGMHDVAHGEKVGCFCKDRRFPSAHRAGNHQQRDGRWASGHRGRRLLLRIQRVGDLVEVFVLNAEAVVVGLDGFDSFGDLAGPGFLIEFA